MMATLVETYPTLARIVGEDWIESGLHELMARPLVLPFFDQLEDDLRYLKRTVPEGKLIQCFRDMLRDRTQCQKAMYEIYTDAAFAYISDAPIQLHVPKTEEPNSKGFDFRVWIKGCVINGEVKTRKDESLWRSGQKTSLAPGIDMYGLRQATVDPDFSESHQAEQVDKKIPASKELRQLIEKTLEQLPDKGPNIIVLGAIEANLEDLENALYGDEVWGEMGAKPMRDRVLNGLFSGFPGFEAFNKLNAVIWLKLIGYRKYWQIFFNPHANDSLPPEVKETLIKAFERKS